VGGEAITYSNVNVDSSNAAAIYIANEGSPYYTYSSNSVSVLGGILTHSNTNSTVDHGAIVLYSARPGFTLQNLLIDGLQISDTRATASRQVGVLSDGGTVAGAMLRGLTFLRGGTVFGANVPAASYSTVNWVVNGVARPDHLA